MHDFHVRLQRTAAVQQALRPGAWRREFTCSFGLSSTWPPYARIIKMRSLLTLSGMTAVKRNPSWAQTIASAMLVEPLDASTTFASRARTPARHALARI